MGTITVKNNQSAPSKPILRYSHLIHYISCPHKYKLAMTESPEFTSAQKKSMAKGNLFEFFVTYTTSDPRDIGAVIKKNKGGFDGMRKDTVDRVRKDARNAQKYILEMEECQAELRYEHELFTFIGHLDFIGVLKFEDWQQPLLAITDLKYTQSIEEIWDAKDSKEEFYQALIYVWLIYATTKKLLPFVYMAVQPFYDETIVKPYVLNITLEDIKEFQMKVLKPLLEDKKFKPIVSEYNCLGVRGKRGKCSYLHVCEFGKQLLQRTSHINYEDLK